MSVPAKRLSRSKGRRRRSQQRKKTLIFGKCSQCGQPILPHRVCGNCGYYKGKEVTKISLSKSKTKAKT